MYRFSQNHALEAPVGDSCGECEVLTGTDGRDSVQEIVICAYSTPVSML